MHYEFVPGDTRLSSCGQHTLRRIRALVDLPLFGVRCGDMGGYIEAAQNLTGLAWVADSAQVYDKAQVTGHAWVRDNACICDNAVITDSAQVTKDAHVCEWARVGDKAIVTDHAIVSSHAQVCDVALVQRRARICGHANIGGDSCVGDATVDDHAVIKGNAWVCGGSFIGDNAYVAGNVSIRGRIFLVNHALLLSNGDYFTLGPARSSGRCTHAYRDKMHGVYVICGCFNGTVDQFLAAIEKTHKDNPAALAQYRAFHATIVASFAQY